MSRIDFTELKQELRPLIPSLVVEWLPGGKWSGSDGKRCYRCCDPVTHEDNPSLLVFQDGNFVNKATGRKGGDIIALYAYLRDVNQRESAQALSAKYLSDNDFVTSAVDLDGKHSKKGNGFKTLRDLIDWYCRKNTCRFVEGNQWIYQDSAGKSVLAVIRFSTDNGKQYSIARFADGVWHLGVSSGLWPLFNLPAILNSPDKPVIFCEGEKSATAAAQLLPGYVSTTTVCGAQSPQKSDFSFLVGRDVVVWPDNDKAGLEYRDKVARLLQENRVKSVRSLRIPDGKPQGWDAADALNEGFDVTQWWSSAIGHVDDKTDTDTTDFLSSYTDMNGSLKIKVSLTRLYQFIESQGYLQIFISQLHSQPEWIIVKITDNLIDFASLPQIKAVVCDFLRGRVSQQVLDLFVKGINVYIEPGKMDALISPRRIEFATDDMTCLRFFYQNGWLEVTQDTVQLKPYSQLKGYLWSQHRLNRDFYPIDSSLLPRSEFNQFVHDICTDPGGNCDTERYLAVKWHLGYLLHRYHCGTNRAVILTEANLDVDKSEGRTGKGLLMRAVGMLRNVVIIDGKSFNVDDRFKWQLVDFSTQVVFLDDLRFFSFESLYSVLSEGFAIEKKNQQAVYLDITRSPKFALSTNKAITDTSGSARARITECELLCYYNRDYTPFKKYGHWFFRDWDSQEWGLFDNFMVSCVQHYLQIQRACVFSSEPPVYNSDTIEFRKLVISTSQVFVDFVYSSIKSDLDSGRPFKVRTGVFYQDFLAYSGLEKQDVSDKKFRKWLTEYCRFNKLLFVTFDERATDKVSRFYDIRKSS